MSSLTIPPLPLFCSVPNLLWIARRTRYGKDFNYVNVGVSVRQRGSYFSKVRLPYVLGRQRLVARDISCARLPSSSSSTSCTQFRMQSAANSACFILDACAVCQTGQKARHAMECTKCKGPSGRREHGNAARCDWFDSTRPFLLSLENPDDPTFDVGRNSYNFPRVRRAMEFASQVLSVALTEAAQEAAAHPKGDAAAAGGDSLLGRIIAMDEILAERQKRLSGGER